MELVIKNPHKRNVKSIGGAFLLSCSVMLYELGLTRLLSAILFKNVVYLSVTTAVFGIAVGNILYTKFSERLSGVQSKHYLLMGVFSSGALLFIYHSKFIDNLLVYIGVSIIPFIVGGWMLAVITSTNKEQMAAIYASDLLGAGAAVALFVLLFESFGFHGLIIILFLICVIGATLMLSGRVKAMFAVLLVFLVMSLPWVQSSVKTLDQHFASLFTSPSKIFSYLGASDNDLVIDGKWTLFGRMDVLQRGEHERLILTDGGASAPLLHSENGNVPKSIVSETGYIGHLLGSNEDTLLIGSGGGKDVWMALEAGARSIDAVEINPFTVEYVNDMGDFGGNVYDQPLVTTHVEDGRSFVETTTSSYDHIYISMVMTNSMSNGMASLSETYVVTTEAFDSYFSVLNEEGRISMMVHDGLEMIRVVNMWAETLINNGIPEKEVYDYIAVVNGMAESQGTNIKMPLLMLFKKPISPSVQTTIFLESEARGYPIVHSPALPFILFDNVKSGDMDKEDIWTIEGHDLSPATDNRPYFFGYNFGILNIIEKLLVASFAFGVIFLSRSKNLRDRWSGSVVSLSSLGFMMVQVALIQQFSWILNSSLQGFLLTIIVIFMFGGVGSYLSGKIRVVKSKLVLVLSSLLFVLPYSMDFLKNNTQGGMVAVFLLLLATFPIGGLTAITYPSMIRLGDHGRKHTVSMMFLSGIFSICGSLLSIWVSQKWGTAQLIILAAVIYLIVSLVWSRKIDVKVK